MGSKNYRNSEMKEISLITTCAKMSWGFWLLVRAKRQQYDIVAKKLILHEWRNKRNVSPFYSSGRKHPKSCVQFKV